MNIQNLTLLLLVASTPSYVQLQNGVNDSVGYLLKCSTSVQIKRGESTLTVKDMFRLKPGDRLVAPSGQTIELAHTSVGKQYKILAGESAVVERNGVWIIPPKPGNSPVRKECLKTRDIPKALARPQISINSNKIMGSVARGLDSAPFLGNPQPFGALESMQNLALRWTNTLPSEQMVNKKLTLIVRRDGEREPFLIEELPGGSTTFALSNVRLEPGQLYYWEVLSPRLGNSQQKTGGAFWQLSESELLTLSEIRKAAESTFKFAPNDPSTLCILSEQLKSLGLFQESLSKLEKALFQEPKNEVILNLISSMRIFMSNK